MSGAPCTLWKSVYEGRATNNQVFAILIIAETDGFMYNNKLWDWGTFARSHSLKTLQIISHR